MSPKSVPTLALAKAVLLSPLPSQLASSHSVRWIGSDAMLCPSVHSLPEVHHFPLKWSDGCYTWTLVKARPYCSKLPLFEVGLCTFSILEHCLLSAVQPTLVPRLPPVGYSFELCCLLWPIPFGLFALLV